MPYIILEQCKVLSSPSKKIYQMFKRKGEWSKAFLTKLKKKCRISKEVHPLRKYVTSSWNAEGMGKAALTNK